MMSMIILIICCLIVVFFGVLYFCFRRVFHERDNRQKSVYTIPQTEQYQKERNRMMNLIKETDLLPFEEVQITSYDGLTLVGRYYHKKDGAPLHIQVHGYRSSGVRDFCGANKIAREAGHNTLLIDQRAHGRSGGHVISFGVNESRDCVRWAEYAMERFGGDVPVFLSGISMGASSVLLATGQELTENVVGIIADCPYCAAENIICKVIQDMNLPSKIVYPILQIGAVLFGRFRLDQAEVRVAVKYSKLPILLIHGQDDRFVPWEMSAELYEANPEKITFVAFPGAGHGISYIVDTERYERAMQAFVQRCLNAFV